MRVVAALLLASVAGFGASAKPIPKLHVVASVRVGGGPTWLASGAGSLWVANYGNASVQRIDPQRNVVTARIDPLMDPYGVAYGAGSAWASSFDKTSVSRIDPATNRVVALVDVGGAEQAGLLATDDAVWVALYGEGEVVRISPSTNSVAARIHVGGRPEDVAAYAGALWVPNENGTLARIDPQTNTVVATIQGAGADPDNALGCAGKVWTTNLRGPIIVGVDPVRNRVATKIRVGTGSVGLACGKSLWTANYVTGSALRISLRTHKLTGRSQIGIKARAVDLTYGSVWFANQGSGTITRVQGG
jgi:DNA-binding beta-propeller fold protein YncE